MILRAPYTPLVYVYRVLIDISTNFINKIYQNSKFMDFCWIYLKKQQFLHFFSFFGGSKGLNFSNFWAVLLTQCWHTLYQKILKKNLKSEIFLLIAILTEIRAILLISGINPQQRILFVHFVIAVSVGNFLSYLGILP